MKSFIYTYHEGKPPRDGSGVKKHVCIYRVIRNTPVLVARGCDTFVSEFQLVMMTMEAEKLLPRKAFERNPNTAGYRHCRQSLKDNGIANISGV